MKLKIIGLMVLFVVGLLAVSGIAAASVEINSVEVEGREFEEGDVIILGVEKNDELEVRITTTSDQDEEDVQVSAYIRGNDRDLIEDVTDTFDMKTNVSYVKKLMLDLPQRMDQKRYTLIVRVEDNTGSLADELDFSLEVDAPKNEVQIRDVILSPENYVKAGRALIAAVRVKNRGESQEEDIKVKVSLPELGISASDYIDELDPEDCPDGDEDDCDDSTTSEELYLRIPDCAEPGEYTVRVCVEYDDGDEEECETRSIDVVEGDLCPTIEPSEPSTESKTIITIGPESQDITAGESAVYSVTLTNQGTESKTYSVSADVGDWGETTITPTNVAVLSPGESKSVLINLGTDINTAEGEQMFSVTISSGDKVLKQVPLKANIEKSAAAGGLGSIKRGLEIGLIILVVLLVILGLIIGFSKLRSNEDEGKEEQTYY